MFLVHVHWAIPICHHSKFPWGLDVSNASNSRIEPMVFGYLNGQIVIDFVTDFVDVSMSVSTSVWMTGQMGFVTDCATDFVTDCVTDCVTDFVTDCATDFVTDCATDFVTDYVL